MASIQAEGLSSTVYLADSVELAAAYAETECRSSGGHVVVLEALDVDPGRLWPDDNAMGFPVNCSDACLDEIDDLIERDDWPYGRSAQKAWPVSWAAVGSAEYDGRISDFRVVLED